MELEAIAKIIEEMSFGEKENYLMLAGRKQNISFETGKSAELVQENPERFINVGSRTLGKEEFKSEEEYRKACLSNAAYLYEKFPLIFEFYDELTNGITHQAIDAENTKKR